MLSLNSVNFINRTTYDNIPNKKIYFGASAPIEDTFERSANSRMVSVYDPISNSFCSSILDIDLSKPQQFKLLNNKKISCNSSVLPVDYNPERYDFLIDKISHKPIKVNILYSVLGKSQHVFNFMSEDLTNSFGYVHFSKIVSPELEGYFRFCDSLLLDDYEKGLFGSRVIVEYLKNFNEKAVGGIGKLADKMVVKFCLDNGIFSIVSEADKGSHVAHYLRGKRFFELNEGSIAYEFFTKKYGSSDINAILEKLIMEAKKTGERVNIRGWGLAAMYMPKEVFQKYALELAKRPIP